MDDYRVGECMSRGWDVETSTSPTEADIAIWVDRTKPKGWPDRMIVLRMMAHGRIVKDITLTAEQAENMASLLVDAAAEARK